VILKYLVTLCSLLHLQACAIRLAHEFQRGTGRHAETNSYLVWRAVTYRHSSLRGNSQSYVDALDWAVQTMLGQSAYITTAEGVMSRVEAFAVSRPILLQIARGEG